MKHTNLEWFEKSLKFSKLIFIRINRHGMVLTCVPMVVGYSLGISSHGTFPKSPHNTLTHKMSTTKKFSNFSSIFKIIIK